MSGKDVCSVLFDAAVQNDAESYLDLLRLNVSFGCQGARKAENIIILIEYCLTFKAERI